MDAHEIAYYAVRGTDRDPVKDVEEVKKMIEEYAEQRAGTASAVDTIVKYTIKPLQWTKKGKKIYAEGTGYYIDIGHSSYYVGNVNGDFAVTRGLDRAKEIASERYKAGLQKHLIECT